MHSSCIHTFYYCVLFSHYAHSGIEELQEQETEKFSQPNNGRTTYLKQAEIIKEPYSCSFMQNFLLHFPGTAFTSYRWLATYCSTNCHKSLLSSSISFVFNMGYALNSFFFWEGGWFDSLNFFVMAMLFPYLILHQAHPWKCSFSL